MIEVRQRDVAIVERARDFATRVIALNAETWERDCRVPAAAYREAARSDLCRLLVAGDLGGLALPVGSMAAVMERLAAACFASAFSLVVHNNMTANLARNARPELRERLLPSLMAGEKIGAFLLTEPGVGSDATAITTRATAVDGGWRIDGEKAWVSNGAVADVLTVYAQTDAIGRARGIACFVVEADSPGVARQPAYRLLGGHALATGGFRFDDCRVSDDALLLGPGEGFKAAMQGIDLARINVAAMCCGMLSECLEVALSYVRARQAFGGKVADFQGVQWMLADAATDLRAARLLTVDAAAACDRGEPATLSAAHAKKFATRMALERIADCMQVMGAHGYARDHALPRHLEAAKMAQYLDGATEIQNVVISRDLLG